MSDEAADFVVIGSGPAGVSAALPLVEAGRIKPQVYKTFPLGEAAAAHRLMESSQHIGKIVLTV